MRIKYARKFSFLFMWLIYFRLQLIRGKIDMGLCEPLWINPPALPIINEARNEAHFVSTGVRLY